MMTPAEFNPYETMLDLLILEAEEMHADQILVISRSVNANLYFVSQSRVKKRMQLRTDVTRDFLDLLNSKQMSVRRKGGKAGSVQIKLASSRLGHCVSLTIRKLQKQIANVDRTIPISPLELEKIVGRPAIVFKVR